jgi:regulator of nonsense transcripts 3
MSKLHKDRTKVVVRGLPPSLPEDSFKAAIDKTLEGKYDWFSYFPGKTRWAVTHDHARAT